MVILIYLSSRPSTLYYRDEFRRVLTYLLGRAALGVVDGVALRVKAQNLVGYRGRPAGLDFVQMPRKYNFTLIA